MPLELRQPLIWVVLAIDSGGQLEMLDRRMEGALGEVGRALQHEDPMAGRL